MSLLNGFGVIIGTCVTAYGQFQIKPVKTAGNTITCYVGNDSYNLAPDKRLIVEINAAPNDEETQEIFDKVSPHTGLISNIYTVPVVDDINVQICPAGTVNYIAYNGRWLEALYEETKSRWALYAIIAHEIGHYVKAHNLTSLGSDPKIELEADEYAGEIL
ncbi:MAG TPA: M48 family metalloprotease, partial [Pedobacter sp.]